MKIVIMSYLISVFFMVLCFFHIDNIDRNLRKTELRLAVDTTMEKSFKNLMINNIDYNESDFMEYFNESLLEVLDFSGDIEIRLNHLDTNEGIFNIEVENLYKDIFGKSRHIEIEKTLIVEEL